MQLVGKAAIITGGGRGIGRAIALSFAREGADVCVASRSPDELEQVAAEIQACGRNAVTATCDVADRNAVATMIESAVKQLGRLDILVNNAGGGLVRTKVGDDDPDKWSQVIQTNLLGTYFTSRAALPHLRHSGGGAIINVGSGMGHQPRPANSSYNAAKAGVWMFTRCLAQEVWQDKITVNELVPGPVHTELTSNIFSLNKPHPAFDSEWVKQPEDVVDLAMFLATRPSNGPTGQSFSLARRPI